MLMDWLADDEELQTPAANQEAPPWKILVVDDEDEVHRVTRLALRRFLHEGRSVKMLEARNGSQACDIMAQNPDIAVVFLDVVMETDDAGLRVIDYIRNELGNHLVRIIVRTGQAGRAPEISIVAKYDINGYREKTELTSDKLLSQLYTALSSYRDIISLNSEMAHRRAAANKLVQQFAQLEEANRRLEQFAKAASHDLQEPLRKIQLWADRLSKLIGETNNPDASKLAEKLFQGCQKLSCLVDEIKDASMLDSKRPTIEVVDLNELLAEISTNLADEMAEPKADFHIDKLPLIEGDRTSLKLLFSNLISNIALNNPQQGTVEVSIRAGESNNESVLILIQDNGYGIEASELNKLYEPYSNVVINQKPCQGIGLYLSKRIVEIHGGNLECSSQVGTGTEVRVSLPCEQVDQDTALNEPPSDSS